MKLKILGLLAVISSSSGPVWAQNTRLEEKKQLYLAMAQVPGFDLGQLNRLFDATRTRLRVLADPKLGSTSTTAQPRNSNNSRPDTRSDMKQTDFKPKAAMRSRVWMPTPPLPAYRRTFRRLLAQPETTDRYDELILKYARAYHLDARLLKAVIAAESEFFLGAISPKGARGLMQVMSATAEEMGVAADRLHQPSDNIRAGAAYLASLFQAAWKKYKLKGVRFSDAPFWLKQRIIASYNAGPRFLFGDRRWYAQTADYVKKVILFYHSPVTDLRRARKALNAYPPIAFSFSPVTLY
ncbi:MAG: hypothetical protein A3J74_10775 [Elusimicrobia bacterium RIFCSPHIGHO2_02_FULL_57_9]|nr:MAG: hypothetical protein A3J74_10775 [Elusimicrobia bacterium RIFCSPHIGHO2_02_FULL_57_9]